MNVMNNSAAQQAPRSAGARDGPSDRVDPQRCGGSRRGHRRGGWGDRQPQEREKRIYRCDSLIYVFVPVLYALATLVAYMSFVATNTAETVRDPNSGHLTDYGRQRILEGRDKCRVQDLLEPRALARDPLELPHCSYEWKGLAQLLIAVSKHLNDRFQLPEDNQYLMCSWATVLRRARQAQPRGDHLYPLKIARSCFRFNLRFLASYRAFSATMIVILLASYRLGLAPLSVVFLLCSAFFYVAYENGIRIE